MTHKRALQVLLITSLSVLAPTLFEIFFSMLLKRTSGSSSLGIKLHTRTDGSLFNIACIRAKRKVKNVTVRDFLFTDDVALVTQSAQDIQTLLSQFSSARSDFGITISLKKKLKSEVKEQIFNHQ